MNNKKPVMAFLFAENTNPANWKKLLIEYKEKIRYIINPAAYEWQITFLSYTVLRALSINLEKNSS